jgi:heat shock protein HtpX
MKFITRSLFVLVVLYGMVFALGDLLLLHARVPVYWGVAFAVAFIGAQYMVSPWLIERCFAIEWDDPPAFGTLPSRQREFVEELCRKQGLPKPRLGVIESGTPNAFAFGRLRSDARVVVTRGLLDILTDDEANAVLAHEVGHVAHYDFAIMATAALAPLLLYQIYVFTRRVRRLRVFALGAYGAYLLGQFLVLLLNRTREYHADHYSACVTHQPGDLSSALVKISYGMVKADGEYRRARKATGKAQARGERSHQLGHALSLMGISALNSGSSLALGMANPEQSAKVMQWDLINPWAKLYELNSTHPLTAFRVRALNRVATEQRQGTPFELPVGGRVNWTEFAWDLVVWALPAIGVAAVLLPWIFRRELAAAGYELPSALFPFLLVALGTTWAAKIMYRYQGECKPARVAELLEDMEASQMRSRAVTLRGEIVGNGVPGAFWSADLVLRDETGLMFLLYRSSIPLGRLWFGIGDASRYIGEQVTVQGWYRRGLRPYVEMAEISAEVTKGKRTAGMTTLFDAKGLNQYEAEPLVTEHLVNRSYSRWIQLGCAALVTAAGLILWAMSWAAN